MKNLLIFSFTLKNMKTEEIISMISDLPLNVQLKVRRKIKEFSLTSTDTYSNGLNNNVN